MSWLSRMAAKAGGTMVLFLAVALHAQTPSAPVLSSPLNGAVGQSTSPTLSWNVVSGASSYTLQLDTTSTFLTMLVNQGGIQLTSQLISSLTQNTTYYWRLSATGTGGTSAWSSIWSFISSVTVAPTLSSPTNGTTTLMTAITMSWTAPTGATTYGLQVSTVATFASVVYQTGLAATSASVAGLSNNTIFYWKANATYPAGTSTWSSIWNFTVGTVTATPTLVCQPMAQLTSLYP